ncbi:MAG: vWA domain-containing protein, partial [Thermomicrobiales bacterium]
MSILWPLGLLALAAVPSFVLLYMRHTEPRVRRFPAIRFWRAAEPTPTPESRFRKPPITLPLILQVLAALALALALARPVANRALEVFGLDLQTDPRHLVLLLDGSSSMAADAGGGISRWEAARADAAARLAALSEGDAATVLVLGSHLRSFGATDGPSLTALGEQIAALPQPGGRANLDGALTLAADLLTPGRQNEIVLLTDGALVADPAVAARVGAPVDLEIVPGGGANVAIVSIAARPSPGAPNVPSLYTRIVNYGPAPVSAPVTLWADGLEAGRQEVEIPANGGAVELGWALPAGTGMAEARLTHDDALQADNQATLPLALGEGSLALRMLLVSDSASPLERVLEAIPGATVRVEPGQWLSQDDTPGQYDLVVLEGVAPSAEALARLNAPLLIVSPQPGGALPVTGVLTAPTVSRIAAGDPLLTGVDLSGVTFGEAALLDETPGAREINGAEGGPLAVRERIGDQNAIVLAFDLNGSNLTRRIAFPILIANAVRELAPAPPPAA